MRKANAGLIALVVLGVAGAVAWWRHAAGRSAGAAVSPAAEARAPGSARSAAKGVRVKRPAKPAPGKPASRETAVAVPVAEAPFAPFELKVADAIQEALDGDDFEKVAAQVKEAAAMTNAAVRAKAVEALNWFGQKALPELTLFMADADEDVRTAAIDAWTMGLSQMEADEEKAKTVRLGLSVVTDRGQLEAMVMQLDELSDFQKLNVLTQVIEGDNKTAAEVAREHYRFWTEEDYTGPENAQKWLDANASERPPADGEPAPAAPE